MKLKVKANLKKASFTPEQLEKLKAAYENKKFMDPEDLTKFHALFEKLNDEELQQLIDSKVNFVSGLARNTLNRRTKAKKANRDIAKTASSSFTVYEANKQVDVPGFSKLQVYIRLWYNTPNECGGALYLDCAPLANGGPQDSDYFIEIPNTNKSKIVRGRHRISDYGWDEISDLLGMENLLAKVPDRVPVETIASWYKKQTGGDLLNSLQKPLGLEASRKTN
jgi:hypothetical protein